MLLNVLYGWLISGSPWNIKSSRLNYPTSLPLRDLMEPYVLFAYAFEGKLPMHGGPLRLVVPKICLQVRQMGEEGDVHRGAGIGLLGAARVQQQR